MEFGAVEAFHKSSPLGGGWRPIRYSPHTAHFAPKNLSPRRTFFGEENSFKTTGYPASFDGNTNESRACISVCLPIGFAFFLFPSFFYFFETTLPPRLFFFLPGNKFCPGLSPLRGEFLTLVTLLFMCGTRRNRFFLPRVYLFFFLTPELDDSC